MDFCRGVRKEGGNLVRVEAGSDGVFVDGE